MEEFLKLFDKDDFIEGEIVEYFVDNFYLNFDTKTKTEQNQPVIIAAVAKQALRNKYSDMSKFLKFAEKFEISAKKEFAAKDGENGIKKVGDNKYEVKIRHQGDRLVGYILDGTFIFDDYIDVGLH